MSRDYRRIAPTAHFTAQAWVYEGFSHADLFDTTTGRALFRSARWMIERLGQRAPSLPWHIQFLLIRHYAYEARLEEIDPTYVLEVGAGLSPRGIAIASRRPDITYVEVDLPNLVREKRRRMSRLPIPPNYHLVDADVLAPDFVDRLPATPYASGRAVVVTEGVLDYFDLEAREHAFRTLAEVLRAAGGGHHLFESYTKERLAKYPLSSTAMLGLLRLLLGVRFEEQLFANAVEATRLAERGGYDAVTVLDVEALNRSPYRPPMSYCHFELLEARVAERR